MDDRYFRTSSFYLAAFLFCNGLDLVNIDKTANPKRASFVFRDSPEREFLVENFKFGKENLNPVMVDARKLIVSIKALKEKLYQDTF